MFDNAITLNPQTFGGANANKVYDLVSWGGDNSSLRRVSSTATTTPETLAISHREFKEGAVTVDQHLIRLDEVLTDPVLGQTKLSAWMVIRVPRGTSVVTNQKILDIVGRLIALEQGVGNITRILNSEP